MKSSASESKPIQNRSTGEIPGSSFPFAISFIASFVDHIIAFSLHWLAFFPRKVQIV